MLRIATTEDDPTGGQRSVSSVVVLQPQDGTLTPVGRVGGLGKTEQIYSVRYDGDIGYVVTFRQTDPLYTLDLSDPRNPRVRGELKINGYSAYLHPVGNGRILGVGQDATDEGRILGSQVSLFDVSDLAAPDRLDQLGLGHGTSSVEHDHRAFLYWGDTATAVVPLQTWDRKPFNGAVVLQISGEAIRRVGEIVHGRGPDPTIKTPEEPGNLFLPEWPHGPAGATIHRSFVLDDSLVTVSDVGVMVSALDNLETRDSAGYER